MEAWRVQCLIKSLESCARANRADQEQFRHDTHMNGYFEGKAKAYEMAARWFRDALETSAANTPAVA